MKLSEWANVAEIVGALAVIVSLLYVGLQLNDNTSAIRSAAANDASVAMQSWYLEMGGNRQASDNWYNSATSPEPLSTLDEFQFMMTMHAVMLGQQNSYLLSQEGTLDADFQDAVTTAISAVKDLPGMERYWRQRRSFFHSGFADYVDDLLAQDPIETMDIYKRSDAVADQ